jgi:16S rRNA (adenine1518-N6/adenine1519-N6)-dimethyltransferase
VTTDKLSALPPLREIIAQHGLRAEKKLGQNFLLDGNITDKIARSSGELSQLHVIEIGPGPGGLTRSLLRAGAKTVTAVEYDARAVDALQSLTEAAEGRLTVHHGDALKTDLTQIVPDAPRAIIANLPYNIATPLLIGWLRQIRDMPGCYDGMTLMFQREVADRITAQMGTKAYGRLSVMAQWLCKVKRMFDIPGSAFVPAPKVTSSVVTFQPKVPAADAPTFDTMETIVAAAFGQRRKMLRSSLKDYAEAMRKAEIDETLRAEQLDTSQFVRIALAHET